MAVQTICGASALKTSYLLELDFGLADCNQECDHDPHGFALRVCRLSLRQCAEPPLFPEQ